MDDYVSGELAVKIQDRLLARIRELEKENLLLHNKIAQQGYALNRRRFFSQPLVGCKADYDEYLQEHVGSTIADPEVV